MERALRCPVWNAVEDVLAKHKIVVVDPFSQDLSAIHRGLAPLGEYILDSPAPGEDWRRLARDAAGIIVNLTPIDSDTIAGLECCAVIARLGTGYDSVDIRSARAAGIAVTNVSDYCGDEVSEHVLALMLSWMRHIPQADKDMKSGTWTQLGYRPVRRLRTRTMGLVGFGRLARAVAARTVALGMRTLAYDPYAPEQPPRGVEMTGLESVLDESDVISLHVPLTDDTRGLIGREALARMKSGALLINAARGGLVDEDALAEAIGSNRIAGAALDVFENEPLEAGSPLRNHSRILLTPHMAFYSEDALASLEEQAARSVADILGGGESINVVN
jgi:D-3-phosphoglycerate dehydrogenase / 2-oxoglutarate reductase